MYKVITTYGVLVYSGSGINGLTQAQADADARERNLRAVEMGIAARYVAVPIGT